MIKVTDIAYVRLAAPDLDNQEEFLTDFGLTQSARTDAALYMRGTDPDHHIHVTELGDPAFIGLAYYAANEEELEKAARIDGATPIENIDEPGGGKRVRLTEPNGYQIEIVHGIENLAPLNIPTNTLNSAYDRDLRLGQNKRLEKGPSHVKRIGHAVFVAPNQNETMAWFGKNLGLLPSDNLFLKTDDNIIQTFARVDKDEAFVDHHVLLCQKGPTAGLNHIGFEVVDMDDLNLGHDYLQAQEKYEHVWGIGRHLAGAQVFDYWFDPWNRIHEHWTDTDRLNADSPTALYPVQELRSQWGDPAPQVFKDHVSA